MKFNCGPHPLVRKRMRLDAMLERRLKGEKIFAWLPKRMSDDTCRWLEFVIRKDLGLWRSDYGNEIRGYSRYEKPIWSYEPIE